MLPQFYERRKAYAAAMRGAISLNGSFYNTQRMVQRYVFHAYERD